MKSINVNDIQETVNTLLKVLKDDGLSDHTIAGYRRTYDDFGNYLRSKRIKSITEDVCLDYLEPLLGKRLSGLHEKPGKIKKARKIVPLYLLMNHETEGTECHTSHRFTPEFKCPAGFFDDYQAYLDYLREKSLAPVTVNGRCKRTRHFIEFLNKKDILSFDRVTHVHTDEYLFRYKDNSIKYRGTIISHLKDLFGFLYLSGMTEDDLRDFLPKLRIPRSTGIPHTWTKDELRSLLDAIDREDPAGKRNYAILLLAIHSGLRAGDIRNLRLSDIDWERKTLQVVMGKTGNPLELPLPEKVGWSIIDYLKNGRPSTKSNHVFVRHKPPYTAIRGTAALDSVIRRCIIKAGITVKSGEHHGMHSLRSTLAMNMLSSGAALATISQTLGHEEPKNTEIYLKTSIDDLRLCAIDPDEGVGA
mgnify:CR=1 FL=1